MTYHVRGEEGRRERLRQELREERNESDARGERRERERDNWKSKNQFKISSN